jgi:hypothetical protein
MSGSADAVRPRERSIDIRQLEALLAVAEEGSFTAAADRLHTVQSNVSEHIRQLEADLGVQLIVRDRRGRAPTEFGVRRCWSGAGDPQRARRCIATSPCCKGSRPATRRSASSGR